MTHFAFSDIYDSIRKVSVNTSALLAEGKTDGKQLTAERQTVGKRTAVNQHCYAIFYDFAYRGEI